MKNMKKQLFTAVAMLLVATVALGTATYAWFVNNAAVEVGQMDFTASTSTALEIGVNQTGNGAGTDDGTTTTGGIKYGSLVVLADIQKINAGYNTSFSAIALKPASADDTAIKAGTFFADQTWDNTNNHVVSYSAITTDLGYGVVKMVPLWFRASQDMNVWLASGSAVTATAGEAANKPGIDSDQIDKALRVSFVQGNTVLNTFAFEGDTAKQVTGKKYNYDANSSTFQAVSGVTPSFGAQTLISNANFLKVQNTSNMWNAGDTKDANAASIFATKGGEETLVKAYVWLEGCDEDCVTAVSGGKVTVKLNFIGEPATTVTP